MSTSRSASRKNTNPAVERWLDEFEHPLKSAMQLARMAILEADDRVSESIKWSTPTFEFKGNIASFQPNAKKFVSLLFHRGSEIPGNHPILEGESALARIIRFQDEADVRTRAGELQAVIRAWCDWKAKGSPAERG
jgi:hypothetical protein